MGGASGMFQKFFALAIIAFAFLLNPSPAHAQPAPAVPTLAECTDVMTKLEGMSNLCFTQQDFDALKPKVAACKVAIPRMAPTFAALESSIQRLISLIFSNPACTDVCKTECEKTGVWSLTPKPHCEPKAGDTAHKADPNNPCGLLGSNVGTTKFAAAPNGKPAAPAKPKQFCPDSDKDGIPDFACGGKVSDNCPHDPNADQKRTDQSSPRGDACKFVLDSEEYQKKLAAMQAWIDALAKSNLVTADEQAKFVAKLIELINKGSQTAVAPSPKEPSLFVLERTIMRAFGCGDEGKLPVLKFDSETGNLSFIECKENPKLTKAVDDSAEALRLAKQGEKRPAVSVVITPSIVTVPGLGSEIGLSGGLVVPATSFMVVDLEAHGGAAVATSYANVAYGTNVGIDFGTFDPTSTINFGGGPHVVYAGFVGANGLREADVIGGAGQLRFSVGKRVVRGTATLFGGGGARIDGGGTKGVLLVGGSLGIVLTP